ncbi:MULTISPECIES: hypoxanthine phosphoribosyltransferase [Lacticaseibacillus]|uniref:Hypoxanthine phosphoribosyltransferase n=1 Tax=Lacticaseibacillus zeae subsp. silagei TaxID=3068307 RepID=A0ABD7ZD89_LACZE|nr:MULTISPECIES: hypoxanthine phosphoribosyltransferase [Lacticaseibacillus]OFR99272.1 hypoxanthine phosphoribosyltransferase [Lactobacillus sp. HMSC068F07]KLI75853.1 hypoxanthine phosphoribosyltransferase [Lacticaseibacillus casei]MDE3316182.1 hypoxanthine phosphoribosyltransferase [Lacticaseibacillus zeae]WLV85062.1 hypoxanthine phosphoribosyltransferase [Lacticaseibacillus sp. NCIMB 15475]WLV87785.1 hypoxanthine phosphoribosyltransferase [Lacticaseibacillus sp. NCIMB 15474]
MNPDILKVLYSQDDIHAITARLGAELKRDYAGKNPLVVCILKGAIMFMTDLVREIDDYMELDFMDVSSYGDATESSGEVKIIKDLDASVKDRNVLIVEDIVDTGRTLKYLTDIFKTRQAKSVRICALMDKPEGRVVDVQADYVGTTVPNEFVVGYGLDYAERYRNLPYIGVLKPEVYAAKS